MSERVNRRAYSSTVRQQQAERTRGQILDAAWELFEADGYAPTTVAGIARRAGVAADTVYKTFGAKVRVLTALIDKRLAPSVAGNVMERPEAVAVRAATDQRHQVHLFAQDMAAVSERTRPVYELLRTASAVEPAAASVLAEMDGYRLANMRTVARWIAARGPLRTDAARAGEVMWALVSPDVGRLLCDVRGWSRKRYADWLEDSLARLLLPDA